MYTLFLYICLSSCVYWYCAEHATKLATGGLTVVIILLGHCGCFSQRNTQAIFTFIPDIWIRSRNSPLCQMCCRYHLCTLAVIFYAAVIILLWVWLCLDLVWHKSVSCFKQSLPSSIAYYPGHGCDVALHALLESYYQMDDLFLCILATQWHMFTFGLTTPWCLGRLLCDLIRYL